MSVKGGGDKDGDRLCPSIGRGDDPFLVNCVKAFEIRLGLKLGTVAAVILLGAVFLQKGKGRFASDCDDLGNGNEIFLSI